MKFTFHLILLCLLSYLLSPLKGQAQVLPDSLEQQIGVTHPLQRLAKISQLALDYQQTDPKVSRLLAKQAIKLAREVGDPEDQYIEKMNLAETYKLLGHRDSTRLMVREIFADSSKEEVYPALKYAFQHEASWYFGKRKLDSALFFAKKCQQYAFADGANNLEVSSFNMMGNIYKYQSKWELAVDAFLNCLDRIGHLNPGQTAIIYNNLAPIYSKLGQHDKTLFYLKRSLAIRDSIGMKRGLELLFLNMGLAYRNLADHVRADSCFGASVKWCEDHQAWRFWGEGLIRQAETAIDLKNHSKALSLLEKLPTRYPSDDDQIYSYLYYKVKGEALLGLGRAREAVLAGEKSLEKAHASQSPQSRLIAYHILKAAHAQAGNFEKAYKLAKLEENLRDSLLDVEKVNALADMEAKYQNEQKQAQLELNQSLLAQEQAENAQKTTLLGAIGLGAILLLVAVGLTAFFLRKTQKLNHQLNRSNDQKASLLREIHHRVKNNLQVISSLLELQARQETDESVRDSIAEGRNRVKSMALIHQKLYQTEDLAEVDFQDYLDQLVQVLGQSFQQKDRKIHTQIVANDIKLDIDTAVPLGLIVNELVTNAYKYAFPGRKEGNIQIRIEKALSEEGYLLSVSDDGVGLPDGFSAQQARSLGLRLVNILSKQLKGQLEVFSDAGAHFNVHFSEKSARLAAN